MEYVYDVSLWDSLLLEHGYELLGQLDSGSFSDVFAVRSTTTHRVLAVKRMVARREISSDPRILKEITCLTQLSMRGACVIRLEETIWRLDRLACLMLELAPMGNLEKHAAEHWPLSTKLVASTTRQVLSALTHCHRLHIAHRDVNPANVLLMTERSVRLADFGLAFHCRDPSGCRLLCEDYLGRESYLAPEVLLRVPYDAVQADMWSMSSLCLFMLTGKHPFPYKLSSACEDECRDRPSTGKDLPVGRASTLCRPSSTVVRGLFPPEHSKRCHRHSSHDSEGSCRSESDFEESASLSSIPDIEADCLSSPRSFLAGECCQGEDHVHWTSGTSEEDVFNQPTPVDSALVQLVSRLRVETASDRLKAEDALELWKNISLCSSRSFRSSS